MSAPQLVKYALYGVLGFELAQVGVGVLEKPFWFAAVLVTVIAIEQLGIIQSRRF